MTTSKYFFIFALICSGHCNPLGQTTVCESAQNYPVGSSTVCESSPNFPYYPYGLPWGGIGGAGYMPNGLGFPSLNYAGLGSTSICENIPNIGLGLPGGFGYLGNSLYGLPLGLPYGLPAPLPVPVPTVPAVTTGCSTVCESTPNVVSPLGLPMGLGSLSLPMSLPGLGLGGLGLGGLGLNGLGYGLSPATLPFL